MALAETTSPVALAAGKQNWIGKYWGLVAACAVLILISALPTPEGLSLAGQRVRAIFGCKLTLRNGSPL